MRVRSAAIAVAAALAVGFGAGTLAAERQPHMRAALRALTTAKVQLEQAEADKGGHREKALARVNDAIAEVQAGIRYNNRHPGE